MHAGTHMNDCIHTTGCTCMHACIWASSSTSSDVVFMRSSPIPAPKVSRLAMSTGQYVTHAPSVSRKNAANVSAMNELQTQKECRKLSRHFCWKTQTKMSTFFLRLIARFCAHCIFLRPFRAAPVVAKFCVARLLRNIALKPFDIIHLVQLYGCIPSEVASHMWFLSAILFGIASLFPTSCLVS